MSTLGFSGPVPAVKVGPRWIPYGEYLGRAAKGTDGKWRTQLQHRHVIECELGRPLVKDDHVHHLNEVKTDNRRENLQLLTKAEHCREHFKRGKTMASRACAKCGETFSYQAKYKDRLFCSRRCWARTAGVQSGVVRQQRASARPEAVSP